MRLGFGRSATKRAAVLGCGPSGLFAAHALIQNGWDVRIFSKKRKSDLYGCQYLNAPVPGLTDGTDPVLVSYRLRGEVEGYREKVYGLNPVRTSVEVMGETHHAWDIRRAYAKAWDLYSGLVQDQEVTPEFLGILKWNPNEGPIRPRTLMDTARLDVVVNSIPMRDLCYQRDAHQFHSTSIWAMGDAPERGQTVPFDLTWDFEILCDGTKDVGWYRASKVYGYKTVEWPAKSKPPIPGVAQVEKPLFTDCTCYRQGRMPYNFVPVGRYGQWTKGVLAHHAYIRAAQL